MPFPLSIHSVVTAEGLEAKQFAAALAAQLVARHAVDVVVSDGCVTFRAGLARGPFRERSLGAISRGLVTFSRSGPRELEVRYELITRDLVVITSTLSALIGALLGLLTGSAQAGIAIGLAYWLALTGGNYLLTRIIFRHLVRRSLTTR